MGKMINRFYQLEATHVDPGLRKYLWRIFGFIGHNFYRKKPPQVDSKHGLKLLNLGSGGTKKIGFVNADFYRLHKQFGSQKVDWMLDLTKAINCEDNYWDGILIEHVNEHLLYSQNYLLFQELYRTLRPKGVLRVVVPDLGRYLSWEELRLVEPKMARYKSQAEAVSNLTQNHEHISTWNSALLQEVLEDIGFVDILEAEYGNGGLEELVHDSKKHSWQSLYFEAKKP